MFEPKYGTFYHVTEEMNLNSKDWDPTIEEALHLITHMGYAQAYPNIFGQHKNSKIAKLMDEAKEGYFENAQHVILPMHTTPMMMLLAHILAKSQNLRIGLLHP